MSGITGFLSVGTTIASTLTYLKYLDESHTLSQCLESDHPECDAVNPDSAEFYSTISYRTAIGTLVLFVTTALFVHIERKLVIQSNLPHTNLHRVSTRDKLKISALALSAIAAATAAMYTALSQKEEVCNRISQVFIDTMCQLSFQQFCQYPDFLTCCFTARSGLTILWTGFYFIANRAHNKIESVAINKIERRQQRKTTIQALVNPPQPQPTKPKPQSNQTKSKPKIKVITPEELAEKEARLREDERSREEALQKAKEKANQAAVARDQRRAAFFAIKSAR
jgi:DNA segregation ATPase FtsK/SpoIIIE-like protein